MTGNVSAVPVTVRDLLPHPDFFLLPAVMDQHLDGIPEIVPEHVKCRAHRCKRVDELECEEHGESGVFLSERLTRLPAVTLFPHETPPRETDRADQSAQKRNLNENQRREFRVVVNEERGGTCNVNRVMTQRRKEKFASFEGHSFACLKNMRVTVAAAIGTPMMIARLIATSLKKNREKFPVTSGRSPSRDMLTPRLVMTNAATT